jgi:transcriptional regulator with XRE-family HTH domain
MRLKDVFIKNLKKYRKIEGISQMRLAELCESSTSYIGQIEIGNKFPSMEMIENMSRALQIRPYLFFLDEFDPAPQAGTGQRSPKPYAMPEAAKDELINQLNTAIRRVVKKQ